jgi:hypothetical protein
MSDISQAPAARSSNSGPSVTSASSGQFSSESSYHAAAASSGNGHTDLLLPRQRSSKPENSSSSSRNDDGSGEAVKRRHRTRHSGGFLLDTSPTAALRNGVNGNNIKGLGIDKGKSRAEESGLKLRRVRDGPSAHQARQSIGSSPLSTEVTNVETQEEHDLASSISRQPQVNNGHGSSIGRSNEDSFETKSPLVESDPVQIVNLALNLSESRRRQASIGRRPPLDMLGSHRRIASVGQLGSGHAATPVLGSTGGSLRYHLQQQRKDPRNPSPRSAKFQPSDARLYAPQHDLNVEPAIVPGFDLQLLEDTNFNPSESTLLRTNKAKVALELLYEYRRLLQYLPELPNSQTGRPNTSRGVTRSFLENEGVGRSYNTLQYIRNRKVRFRDRKTLDAEADGWKNIEMVREWVDSVSSQRQAKANDQDSLPPFRSASSELKSGSPISISNHSRTKTASVTKIPLPRSDWVVTSWDLLADAYWLELDDHKKLVEDREGHKRYPESKSQSEVASRLSKDVSGSQDRGSGSNHRASQSLERASTVTSLSGKLNKEPSRGRHKLRDSITSFHEYSSSQDRKSRWHRKLIRSQSSSSSDDSVQGSLNRQPGLRGDSRDRQDSAVLDRQVMQMLAKEAESINWGSPEDSAQTVESATADKLSPQSTSGTPSYSNSGQIRLNEVAHKLAENRSVARYEREVQYQRDHNRQVSLDDLDISAPNSPAHKINVPRISIDLSRPCSRSRSPRKLLPFPHKPSQPENVQEKTYPGDPDLSTGHRYQDSAVSIASNDGFLSPKTAEVPGKELRRKRSDSKSLRGFREHRDSDSKFRSLLKGSRFADIVSNPVSKVGDLLWRKDGTSHPSTLHSPASSCAASDASESDEESGMEKEHTSIVRSNTDLTNQGTLSATNGTAKPPRFHMSNLPSFRSPAKDSRQKENDNADQQVNDHISLQQHQFRERGRSSRFSRLAPPNLDMRSVSPSPTRSLTRITTRDLDISDESRRHSVTPSENGTPGLDSSAILGVPGKLRQGGLPMTGLATLDKRRRSSNRLDPEAQHQWSILDCGVSAEFGIVTERDILGVRALILSSGVKANEILRRANDVPETPSEILREAQLITRIAPLRVRRSQEPTLTARLLEKFLDDNTAHIRQTTTQLSHTTLEPLQGRIKELEAQIGTTLTSRVHAAADNADTLGMELPTTYRLDIKKLNDKIDRILRRKQRRFRWVFSGTWLFVEWGVLFFLWCIWLVVVLFGFGRAMIRGVWKAGRWLLCL